MGNKTQLSNFKIYYKARIINTGRVTIRRIDITINELELRIENKL